MKNSMMTDSGISVVIPAYNVAHCIGDCLDSILSQTLLPKEIIVVDDGSTDGTDVVIKELSCDILQYKRQENSGPSVARNHGVSLATQHYVAFLDADDLWKPEFLEKCWEFLETNVSIIAVSTGLAVCDLSGVERVIPSSIVSNKTGSGAISLDNFFEVWAEHDQVRTGASLFRRDVLLQSSGFREDLRLAEDLEYWAYLATFGSWGYIPDPLWLGNSYVNAVKSGWLLRYKQRRKACLSVESWEKRILKRLQEKDRSLFNIARGRVASIYAHNSILGGDYTGGRHIVEKYGESMPKNKLTELLQVGNRFGSIGWWFACWVVKIKEIVKAFQVNRHAVRVT